jgi:hypothetical protein
MLGYRTIFDVPGRREDVEVVALSQLRSWLKSKKLDADALTWGARVPLSGGTTGFLQELDGGDESRSVRARVVENNNSGRWTSTLTLHIPGDQRRDPWVWVDIDGPDRQIAAIPRLARNLLEVFSGARTDVAHLRAVPELVTDGSVQDLADVLLDDARRRLVFVAGSDPLMPLSRWQSLLGDILTDTVGLASAYVLDAEATDALNEVLGSTHAIGPGTVRTFLDHVAPGDPIDAQRHRVLTTQRILRGDARAVARVLGARARTVALQQPLPRAAIRVDRLLERQVDVLVLEEPTTVTPVVNDRYVETAVTPPVETQPAQVVEVDPGTADAPDVDVVRSAEEILALHRIASAVLGVTDPSPDDVTRIIELARRGTAAEQRQAALSERLTQLQDQVEAATDETNELKKRLEDEQLEVATAARDLQEANRLVRHLRSLVLQTNAAGEAWAEPEPTTADLEPASFDELLNRFDELPGVVLTMSKTDVALALDVHNPLGTWAAKTWQVLLALRDYVECKGDGTWAKDVDAYLRDAPAGRRTFSATRHARDESEAVKNAAKFRHARELPVPTSVVASATVFMGAHFKIAQSGMISPRLHYFDATGIDGNVYVGYVGPHLPTKQTN